jgi:WD40 repeat protein
VIASLVAFAALQRSRDKEREAEQRFAHALATQAEAIATSRPKLALALAAESAARAKPISAEAQRAIVSARDTLSASEITPNGEPIPVGDVLTTLLTPDGSTIVTGARDGTIRLWSAKTGEATRTLTGFEGGVEEAAVSPDGRSLVAVGQRGAWRWDLRSRSDDGLLLARPSSALWSVAFSRDGRRLATAAENGDVQLYETMSWTPTGDPMRVAADALTVAFTPDGARLLVGTGDGRLFAFDPTTREPIGSPATVHGTNDVWEIVMQPGGRLVATAGADGTVYVWSLSTGELVSTPFPVGSRATGGSSGLAWSPDGRLLYAGGKDGRVHAWDIARNREEASSTIGHDDAITDASIAANGKVLVTLGHQDVRVWDLGRHPSETRVLARGTRELYGLAVSADGRTVATGDGNGTLRVYARPSGALRAELPSGGSRVFALAFLPDGRLVAGDDDGTLRVWDVRNRKAVASRPSAVNGSITSVAVGPKGEIATSGSDGTVKVWSADDLTQKAATDRVPAAVNQVVYTRAGELVTANSDAKVRFWHANGKEAAAPLTVDPDGDVVFSVAVSPDGHELAAATATDDVTLWDLDTRKLRGDLNGQPPDQIAVTFTADGNAVVSANRYGVVTLWNAATGESIGPRFEVHAPKAAWRVAGTPGDDVLSTGVDGTLSSIDALDTGRACDLGAGAFDARARRRYLGDRQPLGCVK